MSDYVFRPAGLFGVGVFGAVAGGSRSGKTLTALRIARGIVGPAGKIAAIDTEGRRMSHYAAAPGTPESPGKKYHFDVVDMKSPYSPLRFCDIAATAEAQGYGCLVTDSFSLEWTGIGGVLHLFDVQWDACGRDGKKKDQCWAAAKKDHKRMRDNLLQSAMPMLFCIRSNEVPKHLASGREGTWKAEQDARFLYEWTFSLTLHPNTPGMPRYDLKTKDGEAAWKMPDFLLPHFPEGSYVTEEAGEAITRWRNSHASGHPSLPRSVREIARDRLGAAGDEEDIQDVLRLPDVQRALREAPEAVKVEIRDMVEAARRRILDDMPGPDEPATETAA